MFVICVQMMMERDARSETAVCPVMQSSTGSPVIVLFT